jgi:cell division protein FtsA
MPRSDVIAGLDIGSTSIRLVVGQRIAGQPIQVVAAVSVPAEGVNRGVVTSLEDATASLTSAKEKAERITGLSIDDVWVGISGPHILTDVSRGVVAVGKANGEITETDVERALEAARAVATPPNYEILHCIPRSFTVDGQSGIKDPIGMTGIRLEVETTVIQGLSAQLKNVLKCVYRAGLRAPDVILSVLAAADSHTTERQRELGVAVVNVGGATTSLAVFEEGNILTARVLPLGSEHITADIAIGLRTSLDIAEQVKLNYGTANTKDVSKRDDIDLSEFGGSDNEMVSRRYVAEIIEARLDEIMDKIDGVLKNVGRSGMLPAGVVFVGGGAKLPGLLELAKARLRLPVSLGTPHLGFMTAVDSAQDHSYAVALGLVLWGDEASRSSGGGFSSVMGRVSGGNLVANFKDWFKSFIP